MVAYRAYGFQNVLASEFPNFPGRCECVGCQRYVTRVHSFSDGTFRYFCGLDSHCNTGFSSLKEDMTMRIFKRKRKRFHSPYGGITCFNVEARCNVFYQPLTKRQTIFREHARCRNAFVKASEKLDLQYPPLDRDQRQKMLSDTLVSYNAIMTPYCTHNDLGDFSSELELQATVNALLDTIFENETYMHDFAKKLETVNHLKERFGVVRKAYEEEFMCMRLPWTNTQHTECSICISDVKKGDGGHLRCNHAFHDGCMKKWVDKQAPFKPTACPNCRVEFNGPTYMVYDTSLCV